MRGMHPETQPATPSLPDYRTHPRAFLKALFDAAVHSAQPLHGMRQWLPQPPGRESGGRTLVLGAGKAGGAMAQALEAAATLARSAGLPAHVLSDEMEGESREVGKVHAALARAVARRDEPFARPCVILSGGETTVTIRPRQPGAAKGRGGRAGEFCLGLAQALQGQEGVWALAADTDGIDGVEDNAGARVAPDTLARAAQNGQRIGDHLDRNDAYGFFEPLGDLVFTGPTNTNVNDFRAILVL